MRRRLIAVWAALALMPVLAACGLPSTGQAKTIDPSGVPFGLLSPSPADLASPQAQGRPTAVYFVRDDRLVTALRRVDGENAPAEIVRMLLEGPTREESAANITSDIPEGTRLVSLDVVGSMATVDLSNQFGTAGGSDQVLAVAQMVYTLTTTGQIRTVQFAIDGKVIEVPDGSGSLASTPRSRADYAQVAPR